MIQIPQTQGVYSLTKNQAKEKIILPCPLKLHKIQFQLMTKYIALDQKTSHLDHFYRFNLLFSSLVSLSTFLSSHNLYTTTKVPVINQL